MESVWSYPRPPRLEPTAKRLTVLIAGQTLADTRAGYRVLETSHPPTYYIPPGDVRMDWLALLSGQRSLCEFKGRAHYWSYVGPGAQGRDDQPIAWSYSDPWHPYEALGDYLCFYASRVDQALVDGVAATAQAGDFYGGWITPDIQGPFKGPPGTRGW
jgi:uncharacterized protein (DUF427 family)